MPVNNLWIGNTPNLKGIPSGRYMTPVVRINGHEIDMNVGQKIDADFIPESIVPAQPIAAYVPQAALHWASIVTVEEGVDNAFPVYFPSYFSVGEFFKQTNGREFAFDTSSSDTVKLLLRINPVPSATNFDINKYRIIPTITNRSYNLNGNESPSAPNEFSLEYVIGHFNALISLQDSNTERNYFVTLNLIELSAPAEGNVPLDVTGKSIGFVTLSARSLTDYIKLYKQFPFISQAPVETNIEYLHDWAL
jgi:hypothetical protein